MQTLVLVACLFLSACALGRSGVTPGAAVDSVRAEFRQQEKGAPSLHLLPGAYDLKWLRAYAPKWPRLSQQWCALSRAVQDHRFYLLETVDDELTEELAIDAGSTLFVDATDGRIAFEIPHERFTLQIVKGAGRDLDPGLDCCDSDLEKGGAAPERPNCRVAK